MKIFEANISYETSIFLNESLKNITLYEIANKKLFNVCGIKYFFASDEEVEVLKKALSQKKDNLVFPLNRDEFGDFQTNINLAEKVCQHLPSQNISPEIVIEPTCGKGNFIIAALKNFLYIKNIIGIEIFKPHIWETKFNVLNYFLNNQNCNKPEIELFHSNIFDFDFSAIAKKYQYNEILIIGNPPWVTNAELGSLNSSNLPEKTNFKNQNGLDAITGKGNFDIAEYIVLLLLDVFQNHKGYLAFLLKNSVIKNIINYQKDKQYHISDIEKHCIDAKKEFNVAVEASLFHLKLNSEPLFECNEFDFYSKEQKSKFGWINSKFVSDVEKYELTKEIDRFCPYEWRQGIKHDCSSVMELEKSNGNYINNLMEEINLEEDLVYGFLKSSDLKNTVINNIRKYTIVTQNKVGQDTSYIQKYFPMTYNYLNKHLQIFQARKSSIYKNKPLFSIFGIGDYSFKLYKVAISGFYKSYHFTLVLPQLSKPVMLDDTCYFIGFDKIEYAVYAIVILNSKTNAEFLRSITFSDAKRIFTKEILMRIDLLKLALIMPKEEIDEQIIFINNKYRININKDNWDDFINDMKQQ